MFEWNLFIFHIYKHLWELEHCGLEWANCTPKHININKCYNAQLIFTILLKLGICRNCHGAPALYVHCFSRYLISMFHNLLKVVPRATLWTKHLRTDQYRSSQQFSIQQFSLTPRTEHQCVPFCDHRKVHTKYMLNISLHFNPQPTPFIVTKYRHTIQLHILSVDTAI